MSKKFPGFGVVKMSDGFTVYPGQLSEATIAGKKFILVDQKKISLDEAAPDFYVNPDRVEKITMMNGAEILAYMGNKRR